jgi:O-methyltransferase domain
MAGDADLAAGGKVLVIDAVLPEGDSPHFGKIVDAVMLALLPGRERTKAEFATLFEQAGLSLRACW